MWVLVRHLPADSILWAVLDDGDDEQEQQREQPKQAEPDEIRSRADFYRQMAAEQATPQSSS